MKEKWKNFPKFNLILMAVWGAFAFNDAWMNGFFFAFPEAVLSAFFFYQLQKDLGW